MKQFHYFIENPSTAIVGVELVRLIGLSHAIGGGTIAQSGVSSGPGGRAGVIVQFLPAGAIATAPKYRPEEQRWRNAGKFWVGVDDSAKPQAADLKREKFVAGEAVELGDGNLWTIPIARAIVSGSTLPMQLTLGEDLATWELRELPEYRQICADAAKVFTSFESAEATEDGRLMVQFDLQESLNICVRALAVNYRVGPMEIDLLGLLTTDNRWQILKAITDYLAVERYAAKEVDREKKELSLPAA